MNTKLILLLSILMLNSCKKAENLDPSLIPDSNIPTPTGESEVNLIFTDRNRVVYSLNAKNGKENWRIENTDEYAGNLTIDANYGFLPSRFSGFTCIDLKSRKTIWDNLDFKTNFITPQVINNLIFLAGTAFEKNTGKIIWSLNDDELGVFQYTNFSDNILFLATKNSAFSNSLYAVDIMSGLPKWKANIGSDSNSTPIAYENLIFISNEEGNVLAFNKLDGEKIWEYQTSFNGRPINLIVSNGQLVFCSTNGIVYSLNPKTGKENWKFHIGSDASEGFSYAGSTIFYSSDMGKMYAYDILTKKIKWTFDTKGGSIVSVPTIFNNAIYFASLNGNLFSLDINTGNKNWSYLAQGSIWGSPSIITKEGKVIRGFGDIDETK